MPAPPARVAPTGAYLAIVGAAIAVGSLVLPWFSIDVAGSVEAMNALVKQMGGPQDVTTQMLMTEAVEELKVQLEPELLGYRDGVVWVATRVLVAAGLIVAALKVVRRDETGVAQRRVFLGGAVAFAVRPAIYLVAPPSDPELQRLGLDFTDVMDPAAGLYVAILGAILLVGAAALAHVGDDEAGAAAAAAPLPASTGAHVPAAYLPGGAKSPASAPTAAYVPSGPPMPAAAPVMAVAHPAARPSGPAGLGGAPRSTAPMGPGVPTGPGMQARATPTTPAHAQARAGASVAPPGFS